MSKRLIPILADALREYYSGDELLEVCSLHDTTLEWNHGIEQPNYLHFARQLVEQRDIANNHLILEALLPSIFLRCKQKIATTDWERREFHQEMANRLEALRALMNDDGIPSEITVKDESQFYAKSEIRELISHAKTEVFLVDPYVGVGTLDCLRDVEAHIRILTGIRNQSIETRFDRAIQEFQNEGHTLEIRRHAQLHDRYLIFNERCWLIGSSIKDAGKKALNVLELVDGGITIIASANMKWSEGNPFP